MDINDKILNIDPKKLLFFSDMDGTFLKDDKTVSKANLDAVQRLKAAGGKFIAATGRVIQGTRHYFQPVGLDFPCILCNGGMIYDCAENNVVWSKYLDTETAKRITRQIFEDFPNVCAEICTPDGIYSVNLNEVERNHWKKAGFTAEVLPTLDDVPEKNWSKILYAMTEDLIPVFEEYCRTLPEYDTAEFVTSAVVFHEMLPRDCSKGQAMKRLIEHYHLEDHFTVAMGDYDNDIEMLQNADLAICPSNAQDSVKAVCDMVTEESSEENSVAKVIDMILTGNVE